MTDRFDCVVIGSDPSAGYVSARLGIAGLRVAQLLGRPEDPGRRGAARVLWHPSAPDAETGDSLSFPTARRIVERRLGLSHDHATLSVEFRAGDAPTQGAHSVDPLEVAPALEQSARRRGSVPIGPSRTIEFAGPEAGSGLGFLADGSAIRAPFAVLTDPGLARSLFPVRSEPAPRARAFRRRYRLPPGVLGERLAPGGAGAATLEAILGGSGGNARTTAYLIPLEDELELGVATLGGEGTPPPDSVVAHPLLSAVMKDASPSGPWVPTPAPGDPAAALSRFPGVIVAGEALGLSGGGGLVLPGFDAILLSAELAARSILTARASNMPTSQLPRDYRTALVVRGVYREQRRHESLAGRLVWNSRLHEEYPKMLCGAFHRLMSEDGRPKETVRTVLTAARRASGVSALRVGLDALRIGGAL